MEREFSIVELTDAAVPAVVELCRVALDLPEDAAEAESIVARLCRRSPLPGAGAPPRTAGFVAVAAGPSDGGAATPIGVVLGSLGARDPDAGHVDLLAVHPRWRRRGVGRALLGRIEAMLTAWGVGELWLAGNPPHYAWPGVDVRYTPAICVAAALGYAHERTAWNMTADLSGPEAAGLRDTAAAEAALAAQGIEVRRATPADVPALVEFAGSTFGPVWAAEVADSVGRPGAGCHLAVRVDHDQRADQGARVSADPTGPGEVLGFAAYGSSRPSWFGPMGTAGSARGLGVGGVLLRRCLRDQFEAGQRSVQIGWVGPVPFYSATAGARIERVFFLHRKPVPPGPRGDRGSTPA